MIEIIGDAPTSGSKKNKSMITSNTSQNDDQSIGVGENNALPDDGSGASFAEKFIFREYEDWQAWAELKPNGTRKRRKMKTSRKQKKWDSVSPYMLLTGVVADACQEGDNLCQRMQAVSGQHSSSDGASVGEQRESLEAQRSSDKKRKKRKQGKDARDPDMLPLSAEGIVVEILSSSSIIVRVTSLGGLISDPRAFVPGLPVRVGNANTGANIGAPKTATQHQHMLLTLCPERNDDDDDDDDSDGGYIGRFMRRLDKSSWLEQRVSGAVGKVVSVLCLANAPTLPERGSMSAGMVANMENLAKAASDTGSEASLSAAQQKARSSRGLMRTF